MKVKEIDLSEVRPMHLTEDNVITLCGLDIEGLPKSTIRAYCVDCVEKELDIEHEAFKPSLVK